MASIPTDMHGHDDEQCHHHVSSMFSLVTVLSILLVLTIATFGAYFLEIWISASFGVVIPQWVNVVIAMSIATVKATLVLMYFMHLRHDNQLNTVIVLFCVFAFALFLGLTGLDLGNRKTIYNQKGEPIIAGGNNQFMSPPQVTAGAGLITNDPELPLTKWTAQPEIAAERLGQDKYAKLVEKHHAHEEGPAGSSPEMSRPKTGLTAGLYAAEEAHAGDHSGDHSGDHGDDHAGDSDH